MYLQDVEPILRAGMDFLRDEGVAIGCFANRYMTIVDRDGKPTEKSYGMSWWKSLAALERWSESHPTHVRIFGAAMQYLSKLGTGREAPALSRSNGRKSRGPVFRIPQLPRQDRHAQGGHVAVSGTR